MTVVRSPAEWFAHRALREPDAPAVTFGARTITYGALHDRAARVAAVLGAGGVRPGDRVGTLAGNHPDVLAVLFGCSMLNAVLVPLNLRLAPAELAYIASNAGLSALVADEGGASLIESVLPELGLAVRLLIAAERAGWTGFDLAVSSADPAAPAEPAGAQAPAAIVYTSGTTGRPKGAVLTNANLWANDLNWTMASGIARSDTALIGAPMFHVGGLYVLTTTTLMAGGRVVILPAFDAAAAIDAIERERVTTSFGVPAMMQFIAQHPAFATADLSSLRLYVAGGAPVPEPLLRRYAARGIPVSQCYGLSEVTSATAFLETERALAKLGSAGRAGMLAELRLVDASGDPVVEPGAKGEICVRGGNVSPGYWRNAEATAAARDGDGWLRTGDVGWLDAEGFLFVCDRVKDMIISGGENVYPAEIENVMCDHPAVAQAAVIGRPDERWGERVTAVVVLNAGHSLTLAELDAYCRDRLARYKTPRELHLRAAMPVNGSGKVVKAVLRAELEAN